MLLAQQARPASGASFADVSRRAAQAREANQTGEAIKLYRSAVQLKPAWAEGWWYLATLLYDADRYSEARDAFRRFVRLAPDSGPGHALLGLCLYRAGDYDAALLSLLRADELRFGGNPEIAGASRYRMILLLTRAGQFDEALGLLARYAASYAGTEPPLEAAGLAALRKPLLADQVPAGDREYVAAVGRAVWGTFTRHPREAEQQYRSLIAEHPRAPYLHFLYGSFLLGNSADQAKAEFMKELEIEPNHVPALVQLAAIALSAGDLPGARPYAERAVAAGPRSFAAHIVMGRVEMRTGDAAGAISHFEAARDLAPASPDARYALAEAYRTVGRAADASRETAEFDRLKARTGGPGSSAR